MHSLNVGTNAIASGNWDAIYARYLSEIMKRGDTFVGRNGETKSLFGCSVTIDLQHGFPLTRLRKMPVKNLFREFLFDVGFDQNVAALGPAKHFWDFLADDAGNLGASAYNRQWRMWPPSKPGVLMLTTNVSMTLKWTSSDKSLANSEAFQTPDTEPSSPTTPPQ